MKHRPVKLRREVSGENLCGPRGSSIPWCPASGEPGLTGARAPARPVKQGSRTRRGVGCAARVQVRTVDAPRHGVSPQAHSEKLTVTGDPGRATAALRAAMGVVLAQLTRDTRRGQGPLPEPLLPELGMPPAPVSLRLTGACWPHLSWSLSCDSRPPRGLRLVLFLPADEAPDTLPARRLVWTACWALALLACSPENMIINFTVLLKMDSRGYPLCVAASADCDVGEREEQKAVKRKEN